MKKSPEYPRKMSRTGGLIRDKRQEQGKDEHIPDMVPASCGYEPLKQSPEQEEDSCYGYDDKIAYQKMK